MNITKKCCKTVTVNGQVFDMIDWDDPNLHLPSSGNCLVCKTNLLMLISEKRVEYEALPVENRIALLNDIIQKGILIKCIFSQTDIEFYELKLKFELENLKKQQLDEKELLLSRSGVELLALLGLRKIHANGTMREIGIKWGEFIFHAKNGKGELMFDVEAVEVAKLIGVIVEPPAGKEFILHTTEGYVGEGRNS
jgi:hypothetical protein